MVRHLIIFIALLKVKHISAKDPNEFILSKFFLKATWDFFRHVRAARWLLAVPEDHHAQLDDRERAPSQRRSQSSVWYVLCVLFHVPYFVDGAFRL